MTSVLFGAKKLWVFRNLWCVCTDKGGWASASSLRKRGGVNFLWFWCGSLLRAAPYSYLRCALYSHYASTNYSI